MEYLTLSLVSHTNVGKTTLARTLLRRDVGEVLDQAHITEEAEMYSLIRLGEEELQLWDTPGFGDSARLLQRLRRQDRPVIWFVQQTWDRITDRPFWCSQQAALNIRQEADVVLYLVNAIEDPEDAGYVDLELELLDLLRVPVLILLNQTGDTSHEDGATLEAIERWRRHTERRKVVRQVLALDAFSRCWVQESELLAQVEGVLEAEDQPRMERLRSAWDERNLGVYQRSVDALGKYLMQVGGDRETLASRRPDKAEKQRAMEELGRRCVGATEELMQRLLAAHELEGDAAAEIDRQIDAFAVEGDDALDTERSAILGSVVSGAVGGLAADLLAGGLTFGGGMLAGAILGALGGAGLARGYELVRGDRLPAVAWSAPFLDRLLLQTLLRYLAVAHFGRGRGEFQDAEKSERWQRTVSEVMRQRRVAWTEVWSALTAGEKPGSRLQQLLSATMRDILVAGYPTAASLLPRPTRPVTPGPQELTSNELTSNELTDLE